MAFQGSSDLLGNIDLSQFGGTSSTPPSEGGVPSGESGNWLTDLLGRTGGGGDTTLSTESAGSEIAGTAIGAGGDILTSLIQGGAQSSQTEQIKAFAQKQAQERAAADERAESASFKYQKEGIRQEREGLEIQKLENDYVQRFNSFVRSVKKSQQKKQQQQKLSKRLSNRASQNDNLANVMINNWGT